MNRYCDRIFRVGVIDFLCGAAAAINTDSTMSAFLQEPIRKCVFNFAFPAKALASVSLVRSTVTRLLPWRAGEAVTRFGTTYRERVWRDVGVDRNRSVGRESGSIIRTAWDDRSH